MKTKINKQTQSLLNQLGHEKTAQHNGANNRSIKRKILRHYAKYFTK